MLCVEYIYLICIFTDLFQICIKHIFDIYQTYFMFDDTNIILKFLLLYILLCFVCMCDICMEIRELLHRVGSLLPLSSGLRSHIIRFA